MNNRIRVGALQQQSNKEYSKLDFTNKFLTGRIVEIIDKAKERNRDIFWEIIIQGDSQKFPDKMWITGNFQKAETGELEFNWLIERIGRFLMTIKYDGGFLLNGEFETPAKEYLSTPESIAENINNHLYNNEISVCYYKYAQKNQETGDIFYNTIYNNMYDVADMPRLQNDVKRSIDNGYLKVYTKEDEQMDLNNIQVPFGGAPAKSLQPATQEVKRPGRIRI